MAAVRVSLDNVNISFMHDFYRFVYHHNDEVRDRQRSKEAINLLYFILSNVQDDEGDREKIKTYLNSKISSTKDHGLIYFYQSISMNISISLKSKSCQQLNVKLPELNEFQCEYISQLAKYIGCKYEKGGSDRLLRELYADEYLKCDTALCAIQELLKPHPNFWNLQSFLDNYKKNIDQYSFFSCFKVESENGRPGHLRYILAKIVKNKNLFEQKIEKKSTLTLKN